MRLVALATMLGPLAWACPVLAQDAGCADGAPALDGAQPDSGDSAQASPTSTPAMTTDKDTWGVGGHPIFGYSPEARWTFGAGLAFYFNPRPWDPDQRLDEYVLQASYTTRKQGALGIDGTTYLGGNRHFLQHTVRLTDTPSSFFGTGPNTPESAEESYTQRGATARPRSTSSCARRSKH